VELILVGGFKHVDYCPYMGCHPNPIDELRFFKMVIAPPTSYTIDQWNKDPILQNVTCPSRWIVAMLLDITG